MNPSRSTEFCVRTAALLGSALLLGACCHPAPRGAVVSSAICPLPEKGAPQRVLADLEVADVTRIPQRVEELPALAAETGLGTPCQNQLVREFEKHFFTPWTSKSLLFDAAETKRFMKQEATGSWSGVNKRRVPPQQLKGIMDNCALDSFPSRNDAAIAVAPGHLRGLPTPLPLYQPREGAPFDMLSYPQLKLNEPLRVMHVSRDGAWYFVETAYSNGWIERRDVALVDPSFIEAWMATPKVVVVRDGATVADGRGVGTFRTKLGTILPLDSDSGGSWLVKVASAGEGGKAETRMSAVPHGAAARFPLDFNARNLPLVGDQLLGQPYGWGELYDLRDCSALLRDLFMPFGIWMPRTSGDQIASTRRKVDLSALAPADKEALIKSKGVPFLTLLYKPGHIMLYVGMDKEGRPLVFHDSWSVRLQDEDGERTQIVGTSAITTLKPGEELGLAPGGSLLERTTGMGTITGRCK